MNGQEVFALIIREPGFLDKPIEELVQMRAVGQVYLDTHRSILKQIKSGSIHLAETDRAVKLQDGQAIGKALLDVETRIGELLPTPEQVRKEQGKKQRGIPVAERNEDRKSNQERGADLHSRILAKKPEAVAEVIKEAEDNEDLPSKIAVLTKVRLNKAEALAKKYKKEVKENTQATTGDALKYLSKLREIVTILPASVPAEGWTESSHAEARSMVEIIQKRLEVWNG